MSTASDRVDAEKLKVGELHTNCYVLSIQDQAVVIDPGADAERILNTIAGLGLRVQLVILTHGHADHMAAAPEVCVACDCKLAVHREDMPLLRDPRLNLSYFFGKNLSIRDSLIGQELTDGERLLIAGIGFKVMHTPGHTPGSVSLQFDGSVITGDCLFENGMGRTDLPLGDDQELWNSVYTRLLTLPDETVVLPGHGSATTIGAEKLHW